MSTNTTLESIPTVPVGMMPATRSVTSRSPAIACTVSPRRQPNRPAVAALTNAPCPFPSVQGSVSPLARPPGAAPDDAAAPGSGRSMSTPSTRRISPENGRPTFAPTVSSSSMVGLA